jgi:hypothetical protein
MLLIPQTIKMKWHQRNKVYYEERGYKFTSYGDSFDVIVEHLPDNCNEYVQVLCDYCLEEGNHTVKPEPYQAYTRNKRGIIQKDCCNVCKPKKIKESNLKVYGKESTNQIEEVVKKRKKTNLIKYGGENVMASSEIRKKVERTNLERYGSKAPAQNNKIRKKMKDTNLIRYGQISPTLNKDVREKQKATMIQNYGVEYGMQNKEILQKARETLYTNGTAPTSRQQNYIREIIGGELNYPFKNYSLDIAKIEDKIYIECDFGGHWLPIKLGSKSEEEFINEERKRYYAMYRNGWKLIRIMSKKDKVPSHEKVNELMNFAYKYLEDGHSWIHFDLDKKLVISSVGEKYYNFGTLYYPYQLNL